MHHASCVYSCQFCNLLPNGSCFMLQFVLEPALIVALRGVDAFARLEALVVPTCGPSSPRNLEHIISPTPQLAFRLISIFFGDHELFADDDARPLLPYLPPTTLTAQPLDVDADLTARPR